VKRTSFGKTECPIARSLDVLGDWWSRLIIRDAFGAPQLQRIPEETRVREEHPDRAAAREKEHPMPRMIDKCAF
jgi:DNA-binding HxlR family transcriptional regulator